MSARSRGLALALWALGAPAAAQEAQEETARRELIAQAEQRAVAADHARALELARRAASIRPSPSLTWLMAREHRALDQLVEALDLARACVREADADAALRNRDTIRQACEAVRASVEPRLGRVEISVPVDAPDDLVVRLDGRVVVPALRGVAVPVMPGAVRVEAVAPGFRPAVREGVVAAGALLRIELPLEREPPPEAPPSPARPAALASPRPPPLPAPRARRGAGAGPWVAGGVGVAALAFAGASYAVALDARDRRDALCFAAGCRAEAADLDARYIDWLAATNVGLVAGGTLLASALVWYVAARIAGRPEAAPRPVVTANRIGVDLAF
jgi:serine/threonine-protein kinase